MLGATGRAAVTTHAACSVLALQAASTSSGVQSPSSEWRCSSLNHETHAQVAISRSSSPFYGPPLASSAAEFRCSSALNNPITDSAIALDHAVAESFFATIKRELIDTRV
jgi:hypothetical protein